MSHSFFNGPDGPELRRRPCSAVDARSRPIEPITPLLACETELDESIKFLPVASSIQLESSAFHAASLKSFARSGATLGTSTSRIRGIAHTIFPDFGECEACGIIRTEANSSP